MTLNVFISLNKWGGQLFFCRQCNCTFMWRKCIPRHENTKSSVWENRFIMQKGKYAQLGCGFCDEAKFRWKRIFFFKRIKKNQPPMKIWIFKQDFSQFLLQNQTLKYLFPPVCLERHNNTTAREKLIGWNGSIIWFKTRESNRFNVNLKYSQSLWQFPRKYRGWKRKTVMQTITKEIWAQFYSLSQSYCGGWGTVRVHPQERNLNQSGSA